MSVSGQVMTVPKKKTPAKQSVGDKTPGENFPIIGIGASASRAFYGTFEVMPEETMGRVLFELGNNPWDIPGLHELLEDVLPKNRSFENFIVEHDFPGIGQKRMLLNASEIVGQEGTPHLILLAMEVITSPVTPGTICKPVKKGR